MNDAMLIAVTSVLVLQGMAMVVLGAQLLVTRAALGRAGAGLEDPQTGLGTAGAVSVEWALELEIARGAGSDVGLMVIRMGDNDPEPAMRAIRSAMRRHERAWRVEHDEVAIAAPVAHPNDLVSAAARIATALTAHGHVVRGVGCSLASLASDDFIDVWYDARSRVAPVSRYRSVAARLGDGASWSSPAA